MSNKIFLSVEEITLSEGVMLELDIYVKISDTKAVKIFCKNSVISSEDIDKIKSYKKDAVVILKSDFDSLSKSSIRTLCLKMKETGKTSPEAAKVVVRDILQEKNIEDITAMSNDIITDLFRIEQNDRTKYILSLLVDTGALKDEFIKHGKQVSAICVLLALLQPRLEINHLTEIALGAFLHSAGLEAMLNNSSEGMLARLLKGRQIDMGEDISKNDIIEVFNKHVYKGENLSGLDRDIYLKHIDLIENAMSCIDEFKPTPGLKKTIQDFRYSQHNLKEKIINPYLPSKILAIGDHLVGLMNLNEYEFDPLSKSIRDLKEYAKKSKANLIYDPKIIESFDEFLT